MRRLTLKEEKMQDGSDPQDGWPARADGSALATWAHPQPPPRAWWEPLSWGGGTRRNPRFLPQLILLQPHFSPKWQLPAHKVRCDLGSWKTQLSPKATQHMPVYRMLPHEVTSRLRKIDVSSNVRETEKVEQKKTEELVPRKDKRIPMKKQPMNQKQFIW